MKIEGSIRPPIGPTTSPAANRGSAPSARPTPGGPAIDGSRSALRCWGRLLTETLDTKIDEETQRLRGLVARVYSDMAKLGAGLTGTEADDDAEAGAAGGGVDSSS